MKKLVLFTVCFAVVTPVMANIASTEYVDNIKTSLEATLETKMDGQFAAKNSALITDSGGNVTTGTITTSMIANNSVNTAQLAGSAVTNDKIASGISMDKLALPDDRCANGTCVIVYDAANGGSFAWENISRAIVSE